MTRPRIEPTKTVRHGRHLDEFWPGVVHSTWTLRGFVTIKRERKYNDPSNRNLVKESWQTVVKLGSRAFGTRYERKVRPRY